MDVKYKMNHGFLVFHDFFFLRSEVDINALYKFLKKKKWKKRHTWKINKRPLKMTNGPVIEELTRHKWVKAKTWADWSQQNNWATTWQNQQCGCVPNEDSDQPGHPPSLIRVFAVRMKKAWVLSYPLSSQWRLWSDWADAQADLSLRWAHTHFVGFVMRRLNYIGYLMKVKGFLFLQFSIKT